MKRISFKIFYVYYSLFVCVFISGAIALAEVLAESRYLVNVDLRENEIRIAGLMALCLAFRMNHKLLHLETPKTFKVEQVSLRGMLPLYACSG